MSVIKVITDTTVETPGTVTANQAVVAADALQSLLGWDLKPEGLCRNDVCVPVPDRSELEHPDGIDLVAVATALGRPALVDEDASTVVLGSPTADRRAALRDRIAPDFTLLDLDGVPQTLAGWTGKKRLLVAFASW